MVDPLTVPSPAPVVSPPPPVASNDVAGEGLRSDGAVGTISTGQQAIRSVAEAVHRLKLAKIQGTTPSVASLGYLTRPDQTTADNLRSWAAASGWHAATIMEEDGPRITDAQVKMADANTRKYKLDIPIGIGESASMGFDQADLFRMISSKADGVVFSPEDEDKYQQLRGDYKNQGKRLEPHPFINSLSNSVGNLANTAVKRVLPEAAIAGGVGAAIGTIVPVLGTGGGAIAGLYRGASVAMISDTIIQGRGQALLAMEDTPGLSDETRNAVSWAGGIAQGALEASGVGKFVGKGFKPTIITKWLTKNLIDNPAVTTRIAARMAAGGFEEGSTEAQQEVASILTEWTAAKLSSHDLNPEDRKQFATVDNAMRVVMAGAGGLVAGAGFATPHALATINHRETESEDDATGRSNQLLAANASLSQTELVKSAPEVARDMMHTVGGLHQTMYIDPDVLNSVSPKVLSEMGIRPEEVLASKELGQYFEVSSANLLSAKNKDDLYSVLPFVKTTALGDLPDVSKLNHESTYAQQLSTVENSNAKVSADNQPNDPTGAEARAAERTRRAGELQGAISSALDKQAQQKLALDHAVKTKTKELNELISNSPELAHNIVQVGGLDPKDYVNSVVQLYKNYSTYVADNDMTAAEWISSLKVENLGKMSAVVKSTGVYSSNRIQLNSSSNGTTLIHEGSHHFLQMWINAGTALSTARKADLDALIEWSGAGTLKDVLSNETAFRKFHEAVAVGTEEMLANGTVMSNISAGVQKMLSRLVNFFRKIYEGDRIEKSEGRVGLTPEVSAILGRWMQSGDKATLAAAQAGLLDEQVSAAIKNMPIDEQEKALLRSSLGHLLENAQRRMQREDAQAVRAKRAEVVARTMTEASESLGRIGIEVGQQNKLSAFEVRNLLGEQELQALIDRDMISNAFDVNELIHGAGYTNEEFADNLLNPGGTYAIEAMETIRFLKETGGMHEDWLNANYSAADIKIIKQFVEIVPSQKITIPKKPYTYDADQYTALNGGNPSTYARTLLTRQYTERFAALAEKIKPLINGKLLAEFKSKEKAIKKFGKASENRLEDFDIGAKAKIFSQKDVDFLQRIGNVEELSSLKHEILDEAIAINHAISGISSALIEKADIKHSLDSVLEMNKQMREVYRVGDWWDQQLFSRWLIGGNPNAKTQPSKMPEVWQSYFSLLDDIKAGRTEGLHHAWLAQLVSPQIRAQITELTAPKEATGLTSFGVSRPTESFDQLAGGKQKVEEALTSEETNAEARKQIIAIAMIPRDVRRIMSDVHAQGGINEIDLPDNVKKIFEDNGLIKPVDTITLQNYFKKVKEAVTEVQGPFNPPESLEDTILHVLETPAKIQDQIKPRVNQQMVDFTSQESPERLLRESAGWQYMMDMANALTNILKKRNVGGEKIQPETYVRQAENELAGRPVKDAINAHKAYADFANNQKKALRSLLKGDFLEANVSHDKAMSNYQLSIQASALGKNVEHQLRRAKTLVRVKPGSLNSEYHAAYLTMAFKMGLINKLPKWAEGSKVGKVLEDADRGEANRILQMARPENANYRKMTAGNFVVLNEALQMLDRLAFINSDAKAFTLRSKPGVKVSANDISKATVADLKDYTPAESALTRAASWVIGEGAASAVIKGINSHVTRLDEIFQQLNQFRNINGGNNKGPLDVLYDEFLEGDKEKNRLQHASSSVYNKHLTAFLNIKMASVDKTLPQGTKMKVEWTPEKIFTFCAYYGNEYQSNALLEGYGLTKEQAQQILNAMPEAGWAHVNACVSEANAYGEKLSAAHRETKGYSLQMETALPFIAGGKLRPGGFVPLYFDYSETPKNEQGNVKDLSLDGTAAIIPPNASTGREVARRNTGGRPPSLSTEVFGRGLRDTTHYIGFAKPISMYNAIMNANKGELRREVKRVIGDSAYATLEKHVIRLDPSQAHNFIAQSAANKFIVYIKNFASLNALAFNVASAINSHTSQYAVNMNSVGAAVYSKGLIIAATNKPFVKFINEASPHMKEVFGALELAAKLQSTKLSKFSKSFKFIKGTQTAAMYQHLLADLPHRYALWCGAWEKFADMPQQERILECDKLVSNLMPMGATLEKTELTYNENSLLYLTSAFSTVLSAVKGRTANYYGAWENGKISNFEFAKHLVVERALSPFLFGAPLAAMAYMLTADDEWLKEFDTKQIAINLGGYQFASFPIAREMSTMLQSKLQDKPARFGVLPYQFAEKWVSHGWKGAGGGEATAEERAMALAATIGPIIGLPVANTYDRIHRAMEKHDENVYEALILGSP